MRGRWPRVDTGRPSRAVAREEDRVWSCPGARKTGEAGSGSGHRGGGISVLSPSGCESLRGPLLPPGPQFPCLFGGEILGVHLRALLCLSRVPKPIAPVPWLAPGRARNETLLSSPARPASHNVVSFEPTQLLSFLPRPGVVRCVGGSGERASGLPVASLASPGHLCPSLQVTHGEPQKSCSKVTDSCQHVCQCRPPPPLPPPPPPPPPPRLLSAPGKQAPSVSGFPLCFSGPRKNP